MRVGGEDDDARRSARTQSVEDEIGEEEVTEMVDAEGRLEPLLGLLPLLQHQTGVEDEHIDPLRKRLRKCADRREGRKVEREDVDGRRSLLADLLRRRLALLRIAHAD